MGSSLGAVVGGVAAEVAEEDEAEAVGEVEVGGGAVVRLQSNPPAARLSLCSRLLATFSYCRLLRPIRTGLQLLIL